MKNNVKIKSMSLRYYAEIELENNFQFYEEYTKWRRTGKGEWEVQMGGSWETPLGYEEELEAAYERYLKDEESGLKAIKFQDAIFIIKLWRLRHYLYVPFKWSFWKIKNLQRRSEFNGKTMWRLLVGIAQTDMNWTYEKEEAELFCNEIKNKKRWEK